MIESFIVAHIIINLEVHMRNKIFLFLIALVIVFPASFLSAVPALACGGLFCQNSPVD